MPTPIYIRSYDGSHQVHVVTTLAQDHKIAPMLRTSNRPLSGLPVLPCDDLDSWIAEQRAERDRVHAAYLAGVRAKLPMVVNYAAAA